MRRQYLLLCTGILCVTLFCSGVVCAATTEVTVEKYRTDGSLILNKTVDYSWMEQNLPVVGDGNTRYYLQGPVFEGDMWDPTESINVEAKDMGMLRGTAVKDLCDLVGGAAPGDRIEFVAEDGLKKSFPQKYIYTPDPRMGTVFLAWQHEEYGYVPEYYTGMRLMFTADTSVNPWGYHVFGNTDEAATMDEADWYYYSGKYPTTTGLSVQNVRTVRILEDADTPAPMETQAPAPCLVVLFVTAAAGLYFLGRPS